MTNARSRTPEGSVRGTVGRLARDRRLFAAVIGSLVVLGVGAISAAALVGLPTILTSDSNATGPTNNGNAGDSQAIPTAQDFAAGTLEGATLSVAAATLIDHVCAKKTSGKLFYLATCKRGQTLVPVTSTSNQFKACYVKTTRITRKVSNSTTCRATENTIPKVPADTTSLYFCVDSDGLMYFKGTSEPTCGPRKPTTC